MTEKVEKDSLFIAVIFIVIAIVILIDVINDMMAGEVSFMSVLK
jgi:hypothetical protein